MVEDKIRYGILFDYYEKLLTDKQKEYFKMSYFLDYTLQEIALEFNISRNAVFDQIKKTISLLDFYEEKLCLYQNDLLRFKIYDKLNLDDNNPLVKELKQIK